MNLKRLLSIVVVTFLFLTGCQWDNSDNDRRDESPIEETRNVRDNDRNDDRTINPDDNDQRLQEGNRRDTDREQERFDVSNKAAERIVDEVDEIGQAYVLTSKKNAYVAATLRDQDRKSDRKKERRDTSNRNEDSMNKDRQATDNEMDLRSRDENVRQGAENNRDVTDKVKKQIKDIVKSTDKNIDNVYVSTSPDFFDLSDEFANEVRNGKPVEGFFDQIGNMIERVFPQNKQ